MKLPTATQIDKACGAGRWVTALIGKRRRRIAGAIERGCQKPFTKGHVWVNFWGSVEWRLVKLDQIRIHHQ